MAKKKIKVFVSIIISLLIMTTLLFYNQPKTPVDALKKWYTDNKVYVKDYSLIKQIDVNSKESLIFYYNPRRNINCAVIEKRIWGYEVVNISGELSAEDEYLRVGLHASWYNKEEKWVYYGVVYDDAVEKVVWGGILANKFTSGNSQIVYAFENVEWKGGEYHLYDSNDNELDHHR